MVVLVINTVTSQFRTTIPRHESTLCMGTNYATTWLQKQHLLGAKPNNKIYTKNKLEFSHYFCNLVIIFAIQLLFMQFSYYLCNLVISFAIQLLFLQFSQYFAIYLLFLQFSLNFCFLKSLHFSAIVKICTIKKNMSKFLFLQSDPEKECYFAS